MILGFIPRGRHLFLYDVATTAFAIAIAFAMRFDINDIGATAGPYLPAALLPLVTYPPVYILFGLYQREWRYASVREMYAIAAAVAVGTVLTIGVFILLALADVPGTQGFPRSIFLLEGLLNLALVGGGRFLLRASLDRHHLSDGMDGSTVSALIYGAGEAGATVARLAARDPGARTRIVGFLDDDPAKNGSRMLGQRVFGDLSRLDSAASRTGAERLIIAMPSAPGSVIRSALEAARALGLDVRTVPPLHELVSGNVHLSRIRPVQVDDLLRREPIEIDMAAVATALNGASVVVTGGGGSIGSELVRQILVVGPRQLTIVDHHEWGLWSIEREAAELGRAGSTQVSATLADIRSAASMDALIRRIRPDIVFHAAALKHVPLVERFALEGIHTNVVGTDNVLRACIAAGVPQFLLISTDKAVEPVSVMGATKRLAELLTLAAAHETGRTYAAVRFGNVLGSSGSVVPIFEQQLRDGVPLTITHPDATRYFMTIAEAVRLILQSAATSASGEIYVLDMGRPIRIRDLADDLVRLSGADPETVGYAYTGLRPGERLHESLFYDDETSARTSNKGILRARASRGTPTDEELREIVDGLAITVRDQDETEARRLLHRVVGRATPDPTHESITP